MAEHTAVVALDIGGTKTASALVDSGGSVLSRGQRPTPGSAGREAILSVCADEVRARAEDAARLGRRVIGLGVGSAGVIDAGRGLVVSATDVLNGWGGTPLAAELTARVRIDRVLVDNDVHAHALGEATHGAASGAASALFVGVGTGIGASFVVSGQVWHGEHSVAGHLGHLPSPDAAGLACVCGGVGHLEAIAAGPAMVRSYTRTSVSPAESLIDVVRLADAGDRAAVTAIQAGARALGQAVGGVANLLDPAVVVIGGGVAGVGDRWWRPMEAAIRAELLPPLKVLTIRAAERGGDAALLGAAELIWRDER